MVCTGSRLATEMNGKTALKTCKCEWILKRLWKIFSNLSSKPLKMNDKTAQQNHMCKHIFKRQSASLSLHHILIFQNKFKDSKNDWQNDIWKIIHVNESLKVSKTEAMNIALCSKISSKTVKWLAKPHFKIPCVNAPSKGN